jgi:hypothetical protein
MVLNLLDKPLEFAIIIIANVLYVISMHIHDISPHNVSYA